MEKKINDVLYDYHNCIKIASCEKCEAWKLIDGTEETTWCELLREHDKVIMDKITKALND